MIEERTWQSAAWRIRQSAALKKIDKEDLLNKAAAELSERTRGLDPEQLRQLGGYSVIARVVIGQEPNQQNNELQMPTSQKWWVWNWLHANIVEIILRAKEMNK